MLPRPRPKSIVPAPRSTSSPRSRSSAPPRSNPIQVDGAGTEVHTRVHRGIDQTEVEAGIDTRVERTAEIEAGVDANVHDSAAEINAGIKT